MSEICGGCNPDLEHPEIDYLGTYAKRARENGIWGKGRGIRCEWFDETSHGPIAFICDTLVIMGDAKRGTDSEGKLLYQAVQRGQDSG